MLYRSVSVVVAIGIENLFFSFTFSLNNFALN